MTGTAAPTLAPPRAPARTTRCHRLRGRLRGRLRDWRRRYLLAEVAGTVAALAAGLSVYAGTGSLATAAMAASLAETAGYYAGILRRTWPDLLRRHAGVRGPRRVLRTARSALAEAGDYAVAETADTLLVRPGLIFLAAGWSSGSMAVGLLIGKVVADLAFYSVVIPTYELRRRLTAAAR